MLSVFSVMNGGPSSLPRLSVTRKVVPSSVGLGAPAIANAEVGRNGFPYPFQGHRVRHVEVTGEEVIAARGIDHAATGLPGRVERLLKSRGVVGLAVGLGAEIADRIKVGIGGCGKDLPGEEEGQENYGQENTPCSSRIRILISNVLHSVLPTRARSPLPR